MKQTHVYLLLLPALLFLLIFTHYPAVSTVIDSFMSTPKAGRGAVFIGTQNYQIMIDDPVFWRSLRNNLWFAAVTIPLSIALSLAMALWVNQKMAGQWFLRTSFFLPTILPMIAVANIWIFFYTPGYGLLNQILQVLGWTGQNWLGDPRFALGAVIIVAIWKEAGFFMIFYLAALQGLSPVYREAADIEGASTWYFFRRIQWPLLMPTTIFVFINAVIDAFRMVDHIIVMTHGGPDNASSVLLYFLYQVGFQFWDQGYASALTVVLLFVLALIGVFQFFTLDRKAHYQ